MFHTLGRVLLPQSSEPMRAESQQHQGFLPRPSNPGLQHPAQRNNTLVEQCWTNTRHTHARTHTHIHTRKHTHTHTPKLHVSHIDTKVVESERERERARERERERAREHSTGRALLFATCSLHLGLPEGPYNGPFPDCCGGTLVSPAGDVLAFLRLITSRHLPLCSGPPRPLRVLGSPH